MRLLLVFLMTSCLVVGIDARPFPVPARQACNYRKPPRPPEEHFQAGLDAVHQSQWRVACDQFEYLRQGSPDSPWTKEALYYLGVCYFQLGALLDANRCFSQYLDRDSTPRHFAEVFEYKIRIAEAWRDGSRKHLFNARQLPRWQSAKSDALALYEEIFTALPGHDLGARALFAHAELLANRNELSEAIERYQAFLLRFPKHPQAPESFLRIAQIYLEQSRHESHNPDLLPLAEINLRKFRQEFPMDERLLQAEGKLDEMKEVFAQALFDTGRFFERTNKPVSAAVYYQSILRDFPQTAIAITSTERLANLELPDEEAKP